MNGPSSGEPRASGSPSCSRRPASGAAGAAAKPARRAVERRTSVENWNNLVDLNQRDQASKTPLMRAASSGNVEEVRELIAAGADLNAVDFNHKTALLIASMQGHTEVVSLLTSAGAFLGFILAFHSSDTWAPVGDGAKGIAYARVAADDEILGRDTALAKAQLGTAAALLALARASRFALARARDLGSHDPIGSDDFADLATCLQVGGGLSSCL